jgi:hypothetical protein
MARSKSFVGDWFYRGTKQCVKIGDIVSLSRKLEKEYSCSCGVVSGLQGFISVKLNVPFGPPIIIDVDARSISFIE